MATGDNVLTGVAVGAECNIITNAETAYIGEVVENKEIGP